MLGGPTDLAIAAREVGGPGEARQVADVLVRAEVFAPEQQLGFVHPIVQAAIYEDLLPGIARPGT